MRIKFELFFALTSILLLVAVADAQTRARGGRAASDSRDVENTARQFIASFVNLDWNRFRGFFATDATAFFPPSAQFPRRADGKAEIEKVFKTVFERARKQKASPPYLTIEPKQMKIQMLGDIAILTFHLEDPDLFGRRTIVFRKYGKRWLIVHLHASAITISK